MTALTVTESEHHQFFVHILKIGLGVEVSV